jgi:hypothetical protein
MLLDSISAMVHAPIAAILDLSRITELQEITNGKEQPEFVVFSTFILWKGEYHE